MHFKKNVKKASHQVSQSVDFKKVKHTSLHLTNTLKAFRFNFFLYSSFLFAFFPNNAMLCGIKYSIGFFTCFSTKTNKANDNLKGKDK